ncbi:MAG TPA: peptidoglycan DD-metalloendopeptidase family protein [Patescibacteria group bacterium]|nr:peptidoglycan DD-metalloendopeptidase family protein [Patescibacteria group bacterium]
MRPISRPILFCSVLACALLGPIEVAAKRLYQYRDANGVLHVTDRPPADATKVTEVKETLIRADEQDIVDMFTNDVGDEHTMTFVNKIAGPVAVQLEFVDASNAAAEPPLPLRTVLGGFEQRLVAKAFPADRYRDSRFGLRYVAAPGDPSARHDDAVRYSVPFAPGTKFVLAQGFNGPHTHTGDQSRYAVDLGVEDGTPVLCAREGIVMMVEEDFYGAGLDKEKFGSRANHVRVLHADGSMGVYAHLQLESARVQPGQRVRRGQVLGLSGNTGFSTGPHLHFAVQVNIDMVLTSVPFGFEGDAIPLR